MALVMASSAKKSKLARHAPLLTSKSVSTLSTPPAATKHPSGENEQLSSPPRPHDGGLKTFMQSTRQPSSAPRSILQSLTVPSFDAEASVYTRLASLTGLNLQQCMR
eukprot:CAMPEP_0170190942 /NCGR_PEP_ID=MMETSP0040_2-20121228/50497_1 /TAXON_ID=641309 /ORGANISM="Lotharella oceanica, Strain CCMP622" /LENGTH=106 /DNA_ID=CAMNT_0010438909 /DNA_START=390 /DNA_END=710 /DNA_ORIENTATION=-